MTLKPGLRAHVIAHRGRMQLDVEIDMSHETIALVGPNGSGKSTLLLLLLGAYPVHSGVIVVHDTVILDTAAGVDTPIECRRLGYVPQDYGLFPHMTARENVEFARNSARAWGAPATLARSTDALLGDLALDGLEDRWPSTLSGGEKQRLALARALSVEPCALLLDEPLAALDIHARREVRSFLARYLRQIGLPTLVITHDPADVRALAQRIVVLEKGRVTQTGTWEELVTRPGSKFVEELVRTPAPTE